MLAWARQAAVNEVSAQTPNPCGLMLAGPAAIGPPCSGAAVHTTRPTPVCPAGGLRSTAGAHAAQLVKTQSRRSRARRAPNMAGALRGVPIRIRWIVSSRGTLADLQDDVIAQSIVAQPAPDALHDHVADGLLLAGPGPHVCTSTTAVLSSLPGYSAAAQPAAEQRLPTQPCTKGRGGGCFTGGPNATSARQETVQAACADSAALGASRGQGPHQFAA